jgi:hypothetical protein
MSKPKGKKAVKAEPRGSYWAEYYRKNRAKYAEWGRKYRERKKAEKAAQMPTQHKRSN